jgi:hypothetical protein
VRKSFLWNSWCIYECKTMCSWALPSSSQVTFTKIWIYKMSLIKSTIFTALQSSVFLILHLIWQLQHVQCSHCTLPDTAVLSPVHSNCSTSFIIIKSFKLVKVTSPALCTGNDRQNKTCSLILLPDNRETSKSARTESHTSTYLQITIRNFVQVFTFWPLTSSVIS